MRTVKIMELKGKFSELIDQYNPNKRVRNSWLPRNALDAIESLTEEQLKILDDELTTQYRAVVESINFISTMRPDAQFPQHVTASRMKGPRERDMFCRI